MDINDRDSELHHLFSTLMNQHPAWNNMPTQNVGALHECFTWFNDLGKRIDAGLAAEKSESEAKAASADKPHDKNKNKKAG